DYIVGELQKIGAKPLPGQKDFRLPFEFTAGAKDGGTTIAVNHSVQSPGVFGGILGAMKAARALSFSDNGDVSGPVVFAGYGIVAAGITGAQAEEIFRGHADKTLEDAQKSLDSANPHVAGFAIPNVEVHLHAAVEREKKTGHNVVAYLPATTPAVLAK